MILAIAVSTLLRALLGGSAALAAENLALRQQLAVLKRSTARPRLHRRDRIFWVWLSRLWRSWRGSVIIVRPETVIKWHRKSFRLYWRWTSGSARVGRPQLAAEIRALIERMSRDNPTWGRRRIQAELHLLGYDIADGTVAKYMIRRARPPSQGWRAFLANHMGDVAAVDFFVLPTVTFRLLYGFLVLRHDRRQVVHFNVSVQPTAGWAAQQLIEAFPEDEAPAYLLRDRDPIYGEIFQRRIHTMGLEQVVIAPRAPWQNPFVERLIGSIRRECLDHVIVLNEAHLRRVLRAYLEYYHTARPHQSLGRNSPSPRAVESPPGGRIVAVPQVGGLHHRYQRAA